MSVHRLLSQPLTESVQPLTQQVSELVVAVKPEQTDDVDARIQRALNTGLSLLSDVNDYLGQADVRTGMRNNNLYKRLNELPQTYQLALTGARTEVTLQDIVAGTLVALPTGSTTGVVPYGAESMSVRRLLLGVTLSSAAAGGKVLVQQAQALVRIPGLSLLPDRVLLAGRQGQLVYDNAGLAFHHVVGRSLDATSFYFGPSLTTYSL